MSHLKIPNLSLNIINKINKNINIASNTECWEWKRCIRNGYGRIKIYNKLYTVTRLIWFLNKGFDPKEQLILHTCDNRKCCNPNHLFIGNHQDNNNDKENKSRGNHPIGENNGLSILTNEDIIQIRNSKLNNQELSKIYNTTDTNISEIRLGHSWKHIGGPIGKRPRGRPKTFNKAI